MQNTQQNSFAEYVINMVCDFMNYCRGNMSITDMFTPTLAVLYAMHKGYHIKVYDNRQMEFYTDINNDDKLYHDLLGLIPHDAHIERALCRLINNLESISREEFNAVYVEVLAGLFDYMASHSGKTGGEFYTPSAITKLMAYFVNKEECGEILDPFCGTASIIHKLNKDGQIVMFDGQELNLQTSIYARLNTEAYYHCDNSIGNYDSIAKWNNGRFDAIVSCPPFGLRLSPEQRFCAEHVSPYCSNKSVEEILLKRAFRQNDARLVVTLFSMGFCYKGEPGSYEYELRKELIERNLVDTIVALPSNILYGTSVPCIILVCKANRSNNEPVKFIHAEDYFTGTGRKRVFEYDRFVEMIEGDECDCEKIPLDEIRLFAYNLYPSLYFKRDYKLKEGQDMVRLEKLLIPAEGIPTSMEEANEIISNSELSNNFIGILLNTGKTSTPSRTRSGVICYNGESGNSKYLLVSNVSGENRYAIHTDKKEFFCPSNIKVYKVNEELVTPEYLVYLLSNSFAITKGRMPLSGFMMLPIIIESIDKQKEIVNKEVQQFHQKVKKEQEADAKRLGVKQSVSDLEHMLGATQVRIGKIISKLEKATPASDNYTEIVKSLKDNVEYMNRVIQYNSTSIEEESFNLKEGNFIEFIQDYADGWKNYGGPYFELSLNNEVGSELKARFDKTLMTVMLDSILNNAARHSFGKRKGDNHQVEISISNVSYKEQPYVLLSIANNGSSFADGFTVEDYISKGRFVSSTGRSGLGGYHVHQITKGHNGFLCLDSNKIWSVIVDVLIPLSITEENSYPAYEKECV